MSIEHIANIVTIISGIIGIFAWVSALMTEKRIRKEQDKMWEMFLFVRKELTQGKGNVMEFEEGSHEQMLAEKMVEKGWLERSPLGGYALPGTYASTD